MLYLHKILNDDNEIIIWKATEDVEETAKIAGCDNDEEYLRLNKKRKKEWAFVRYILSTKIADTKIYYNENGKPFLKDESNNLPSISISHTGDYIAILFNNKRKRIGMDIESSPSEKVLKVRHKFMTQKEIDLCPTENEMINALLAWTSEEALYKMLDDKYVDYTENYDITAMKIKEGRGEGIIKENLHNGTYTLHHEVHEDFVLTWCEDTPIK